MTEQDSVATLRLVGGAGRVELRTDTSIDELFRASHEHGAPEIVVEGDKVTVRYAVHRLLGKLAANEMTAWIARLVGACPRCWGLVAACPSCAGRGGPGHEPPAVDDLVDWLAPALRRSGLALVSRAEAHRALRPLRSPDTTTPTKQEMS